MPTYEYKCQGCKRRFDVFQSMTDKPLTECTECHGQLKRLIGTGAGFLFKGSGFYITDYRSDSYKQAEKQAFSASSAGSAPATPAAPSGSTPSSGSAPSSGSTPSSGGTPAPASPKGGSTEKKQP